MVEGDEHFTVRLTGSVRHHPADDGEPTLDVKLGAARAKVTIKDDMERYAFR